MLFDNKVAVLYLSQEMLKECGATEDDAGEFVNFSRDIDTAEIGIFIKEKPDGSCRISLRSKNYIDVRRIAESFGGGGHIRAAGCTISGSLENAGNSIVQEIQKYMDVRE
jgi:phosphoesterase RecJ-like protein